MAAVVGVIPVRYQSRRFPGKPLIDLCGKSMIRWVWEGAQTAELVDQIVIATPDRDIAIHCENFGAEVVLTPDYFSSGTDRVAWVAQQYFSSATVVLNIQGDEPLITGTVIDLLVHRIQQASAIDIATVIQPITQQTDITDPAVVKVVCDIKGRALYFSRAPIPYGVKLPPDHYRKHIGIYAFQLSVLLQLSQLRPTQLEQAERLEQLRWLESGYRIWCVEVQDPLISVDTPQDAERVRRHLLEAGKALNSKSLDK